MSRHMTLDDRQIIHAGLKRAESLAMIASRIGKCETTVSREIRSHRVVWNRKPYGRPTNRCVNRTSCNKTGVCNEDCRRKCTMCGHCAAFCPDYREEHCEKLNHPPYVCDACDLVDRCPLEKFRYDPAYAQQEYAATLRETRQGFNLTQQEIDAIDAQVTPLIRQGQSVNHVAVVLNDKLTVSRRTIYRLVDQCALKARNIDLPRKCKLKPRKGEKPLRKIDRQCRIGRTTEDYEAYLRQHPDVIPVQMDSVVGCKGSSKVLLTLWFQGDYMPVFLRDSNTAQSVRECFEFLYEGLGHDDFCALFPVILTDNGSEFSDPLALETAPNGQQRTRIFYCDPMASWQKPNVERCHGMYRRIFPNGSSFDAYTQEDMNLAASHVNSYARPSLGNRTPVEMLALYYGAERTQKLLRLLGHTPIQPDQIVLHPSLMAR